PAPYPSRVDAHVLSTGTFTDPARTSLAGRLSQSLEGRSLKTLSRSLTVVLILAGASFAGVAVSSPYNGATVASPAHFVASASSSYPITAMMIYLDNNSAYAVNASSLDTYVPMSQGGHAVTVQAWDSTGAVFKNSMSINVASAAAAVSVSSPSPGTTVGSPVHFAAAASSGYPISAMT